MTTERKNEKRDTQGETVGMAETTEIGTGTEDTHGEKLGETMMTDLPEEIGIHLVKIDEADRDVGHGMISAEEQWAAAVVAESERKA